MADMTTSAHMRLRRTAGKRLREDADFDRNVASARIYDKMIDDQAAMIVSELLLILNGSSRPSDKLQQACDLLLAYDDESDDDEDAPTKVVTNPIARD
jgi:hypothetical protein